MLKFQNKKGFDNRRKQRNGHHRGTPPPNLLTEEELRIYRENLEDRSTSPESDYLHHNTEGKGRERKS